MKKYLYLFIVLSLLVSCGKQDHQSRELVLGDLIGGNYVDSQEREKFKFIVKFTSGTFCTGSKVDSSLYLLAAHCVINFSSGEIQNNLKPGSPISFTLPDGTFYSSTVNEVYINPVYQNNLNELNNNNSFGFAAGYFSPDIAFIKINSAFNDIPAAKIGFDYVEDYEQVTITGYGCEKSIHHSSGLGQLKTHSVTTLPSHYAKGYAISFYASPSEVYQVHSLTMGKKLNLNSASLCPGDSGGPLLKFSHDEYQIVGVNAYYTFEDDSGVSTTNLHSRFDGHEVRSWMETIYKKQ